MNQVISAIIEQINGFITANGLDHELNKPRTPENKLVLVNNSFPYRAKDTFPTRKNSLYISFPANANTVRASDVQVIEGPTTDKDYAFIDTRDDRIVTSKDLSDAVAEQLQSLGALIYILIGEIDDTLTFEQPIASNFIQRAVLDPTATRSISLHNGCLTINDISDPSTIWSELQALLPVQTEEEREQLRRLIGQAMAELQHKSYARLNIPDEIDTTRIYFLDKTTSALRDQLQQYKDALLTMDSLTPDKPIPVDILRIAYNFTDDALKLVRLLVSVSDLKPLVLWGTFLTQYRFAEALRNLPWTKQITKPKLNDYRNQISKARNRAFHRLLPFSKPFEIAVPDESLQNVQLRIFSEYAGRTRQNTLTFKDKPLVDVLMEFNRTSEEIVDRNFWRRNSDVMEYSAQMAEATSRFLKICHRSLRAEPCTFGHSEGIIQ